MDVPTDAAVIDEATAAGLPERRFVLSALNQRRWQTFKAHKRGYWSLWIFLVLFVISLFAEFIANDKPLLVKFDGQYYFPVFKSYPETAFGGIFETEAVYRDPAVKEMIADKSGWILWPPIPFSYDTPNKNPPMAFPVKPTWMLTKEDCEAAIKGGFHPCNDELEWNWLGTDDQGRDVIARVIYGFRISVLFGLVLTFFASIVGVAAGAVQGYFGGWTDLLFQRFIEIWTSVPQLYLLDHHRRGDRADLLDPARHPARLLLGGAGRAWCAPSFCARGISNMSPRRARSGCPISRSSSSISCRTPWWRRSPSCPSS